MIAFLFTFFSIKYSILTKVYTDEGGIKQLYHGLTSLKLEDYPLVQTDESFYNYYTKQMCNEITKPTRCF